MKLSEKIKLLRKTVGYTQKEFADILKVTEISIQNYENNRSNPSGKLLKDICQKHPEYALWLMTDIENVATIKNQSIKEKRQ